MNKWPPGPWTWGMLYIAKYDPMAPDRKEFGYRRLAMHPSGETQPEGGEWEAIAKLISCAPELYEALQLVMNYPDIRQYMGSQVSNVADAALAKAS